LFSKSHLARDISYSAQKFLLKQALRKMIMIAIKCTLLQFGSFPTVFLN